MIESKQLGIYWGQNAFSFVETNKGQVAKVSSLPFDTPIDTEQNQEIPEGLKFTALIQKAVVEQKFTAKKIYLSLPAKEIIFRSFVIPWMLPEEVKNVVDYEVTKFIPIKLEELSYTFHPVTLVENNQKKIRILFVAIRKLNLEKYIGILEHSGFQVGAIEPSSVSLVRILQKNKYITKQQCNAIIELGQEGGKIIIVENEVVQFVREFRVPSEQVDSSIFYASLFNDIRVSLNFYARQNPPGRIDKLFTISFKDLNQLSKNVSQELNIPTTYLSASKILNLQQGEDFGLLHAFGVALREKGFSTKNFDLSDRAIKFQRSTTTALSEPMNYKVTALNFIICTFIILLSVILTTRVEKGLNKKLIDLQNQLGHFQSSTVEQISEMNSKVSTKLSSFKEVRTESKISFYLERIPHLLPKGTWLSSFIIFYTDMGIERATNPSLPLLAVTMEGFTYLDDFNDQFRMGQKLVSRLKTEEKGFKDTFKNIELVTLRQQNFGLYNVTYFKIVCK